MNDCAMHETNNDILLNQIQRELKDLARNTTATLLMHDGKLAELELYLRDNLMAAIGDVLNGLDSNGSLDAMITAAITNEIRSRFENRDVYYDGIKTEKLWDVTESSYYYVTKIPKHTADGERIILRLGVANDDYTPDTAETTLDFAHRKNATVCINAGVFDVATKKPLGFLIKDGVIITQGSIGDEKYGYLALNKKGDYRYYPETATPSRILADGFTDAVCIFNDLVRDGIGVEQTDDRLEPRQSIGFTMDGDIIIVTCDGRDNVSMGMSYTNLAQIHLGLNCVNAFILDGGGSASTVLHGVKQNENIDYLTDDRPVSSFLYVARESAITPDNNPANECGKVKQSLLKRIIDKVDFLKGFIRLRHSGFQPGIEMYTNAEEKRRSKIGISVDPANPRNSYAYIAFRAEDTEKSNIFRVYDQGVWSQTYHGTSTTRPNGVIGLCYFDESIGKPIWYNGTKWVDATGTQV